MLTLIILGSLLALGWAYATTYTPTGLETNVHKPFNPFGTGAKDKEIFWFYRFYLGNFIYKYIPSLKILLKPLFTCEICMSAWTFTLVYWVSTSFTWTALLMWPIGGLCAVGLTRIIKMIMQK
jgi:hypothetical protein